MAVLTKPPPLAQIQDQQKLVPMRGSIFAEQQKEALTKLLYN